MNWGGGKKKKMGNGENQSEIFYRRSIKALERADNNRWKKTKKTAAPPFLKL